MPSQTICSAIPDSVPVGGVCQCAAPAFNISAYSGTTLTECLASSTTDCPPSFPVDTRPGSNAPITSCSTRGSTCPPNSVPLYNTALAVVECRSGADRCSGAAYSIALFNAQSTLVGCLATRSTSCPADFPIPTLDPQGFITSCKAGPNLAPTPPPSPPVNVSRGIVEPFTGFPKGVAYAAGYIFILHESGQMYRCNVSNQLETCYQQNKMYRDNAFNWIAQGTRGDARLFARRMAMEDDEHIITASGGELYRCSTMNPYSCATIYSYDSSTTDEPWQTIAVGGGRIFAAFSTGHVLSFDQVTSQSRVSAPLSMRQLSVWSTSLRRVST
jgi:hypothetical protein